LATSVPVGCPCSLVQEVRRLQLRVDVRNARKCQDVVVAEADAVTGGGRKQRMQLVYRKAGAEVGVRDIDKVIFAEIGDRDLAGVENERVGAVEPVGVSCTSLPP
jgi:hypothetical protein